MKRSVKLKLLQVQVGAIAGLLVGARHAQANNFGNIAQNITTSIEQLPGLLTGICYLMGLLLGVMGILKLKDHVENPGQTPLKDGAVRLAAGGALFGLPIVFEAMQQTIGTTTDLVSPAAINRVIFNVL